MIELCSEYLSLYDVFGFMLLSRQETFSEWIDTLQLAKCQGIPCLKEVPNLKFKWLQLQLRPTKFLNEH